MANYETQLVVIAGGPAGLSAAVQAAEDGVEVILLEKNAVVGGAANMGMGPLAIGTKYQKRQMYDITVEKALRMIMEYTHYNIDGRLVKRYFEMSAETIEWLEEMGVEFEGAYKYFTKSEATWHIVKKGGGIGPRAAGEMNKRLLARAQELGVKVLVSTPGKKILKDAEGKVCGVLAVNSAGEEIEIACKAAIIATGGAGDSPKMIKEETDYEFGVDMFNFAIPGNQGDGLRMAWEAGADHVPVRIEQAAVFEGSDELPESIPNILFQPNLLVNLQGKRVMDEEEMQNTTFLSNAASHQKNRVLFSIVDSSIAKYYMRHGVDEISMVRFNEDVSDFAESVKIAEEQGNKALFVADTLEELAEKTGINEENLIETVENYNDYCETGDEEFFKRKKYLRPLKKGPYYAAAIRPGGYGTVGGIRISENCECLDKEFEPIPGLYAAGADACNIYDDSYMFLLPGNSMGFAVNTGRIAGMEAARYLEE